MARVTSTNYESVLDILRGLEKASGELFDKDF
jgi:hypothetical protein